jgi:predicted O-linked N-acetylglucosamine transferase (SPINDLY family)
MQGFSASGCRSSNYVLSDAQTAPDELRDIMYRESVVRVARQLVHVRHDASRSPPQRRPAPTKACRLKAFVFCCFNTHYKITPAMFDLWMRLLARVEGSVLWLRHDHG